MKQYNTGSLTPEQVSLEYTKTVLELERLKSIDPETLLDSFEEFSSTYKFGHKPDTNRQIKTYYNVNSELLLTIQDVVRFFIENNIGIDQVSNYDILVVGDCWNDEKQYVVRSKPIQISESDEEYRNRFATEKLYYDIKMSRLYGQYRDVTIAEHNRKISKLEKYLKSLRKREDYLKRQVSA